MQNISLSPHFKLQEFTASRTAEKHGIVNVPGPEEVANLKRLCEGTLEPLREAIGLPVIVTSGFRTKALNDKLAHSSERSQHMAGQAADFYVKGHTDSTDSTESPSTGSGSGLRRELLLKAFKLILTSERIDYDQLIIYPTFIHVMYLCVASHNFFYDKFIVMQSSHTHADAKLLIA